MKRWVIKLGSRVLSNNSDALSRPRIVDIMRQVAELKNKGYAVVVVSSGAVLAGWEHMGFPPRQNTLAEKQFLAAVGQSQLMSLYTQLGAIYGLKVAQSLLIRSDFSDRRRYLNARTTLETCFAQGVVPIVNENDVVAIDEIKLGDNDNLAAQVGALVQAERVILCSDIDGLYTAPPQSNPDAQLIAEVKTIDASVYALAGDAVTQAGTGGMRNKIQAADIATRAGAEMWIVNGARPDAILGLSAERPGYGTRFLPRQSRVQARKRWILAGADVEQALILDTGAQRAVVQQGKSLLPAGIQRVLGHFEPGQTVNLCNPRQEVLGCGLVRYSAEDLRRIAGLQSDQIEEVLGYTDGAEVMHRNDMVIHSEGVQQ